MEIVQLHNLCVKYRQASNLTTSMGRALEPVMPALGFYHEHYGVVDCYDVVVVAQLLAGNTGKWELKDSTPRLTIDGAIEEFKRIKRQVRSSLKNAPIERMNSCSSHKIENSFWHFRINQHLEFYDPRLHGVPNF